MQNLCFRSIKKLKQENFMLENENKYQKNLRKTIFFFTTMQVGDVVCDPGPGVGFPLSRWIFQLLPLPLMVGGLEPLCGVECHMGLSQQDARVTKSGGLAIIRKYMPSRCDNKILTWHVCVQNLLNFFRARHILFSRSKWKRNWSIYNLLEDIINETTF